MSEIYTLTFKHSDSTETEEIVYGEQNFGEVVGMAQEKLLRYTQELANCNDDDLDQQWQALKGSIAAGVELGIFAADAGDGSWRFESDQGHLIRIETSQE